MRGQKPKPLPPEFQEMIDALLPMNMVADVLHWPREWVVCHHCGAQSWRIPPHVFEPCPLVKDAAETQGLKMDAERASVIRTATTMERQLEAFMKYIDQHTPDEDDE